MAKRQTRRAISLRGITYQRLKNYCARDGRSVSGYLEEIVAEKLDAEGEPVPDRVDPKPEKQVASEDIASQHFTF